MLWILFLHRSLDLHTCTQGQGQSVKVDWLEEVSEPEGNLVAELESTTARYLFWRRRPVAIEVAQSKPAPRRRGNEPVKRVANNARHRGQANIYPR